MHIDSYQQGALTTAWWKVREKPVQWDIHPLLYCVLKLNGEAGECAEKLGKIYRDKEGLLTDEAVQSLVLELGDVLWYVACAAELLGHPLSHIAAESLRKLKSRQERNMIGGSGDNR